MNAVDSLFNKWKLEGKLEGRLEVIHKAVTYMWQKRYKVEAIADCFDMPINEVKEVIDNFEKKE
jgi:predicted transposase YdaD